MLVRHVVLHVARNDVIILQHLEGGRFTPAPPPLDETNERRLYGRWFHRTHFSWYHGIHNDHMLRMLSSGGR